MAITLISNTVERHGFLVCGNSADLSGVEELYPATTGKSIVVERIAVSFGAAISVWFGEDETVPGTIDTTRIGPIYGAANTNVELVFTRGLVLAVATALTGDASGAGNVTIVAQGYLI